MKKPRRPLLVSALLVGAIVMSACGQDPWQAQVKAEARLMEKAESLAASHASMDHCREVLGEPEWVLSIEDYTIWEYRLPKPGRPVDDLLGLIFEPGSSTVSKVGITYVDSWGPSRPTPIEPSSGR